MRHAFLASSAITLFAVLSAPAPADEADDERDRDIVVSAMRDDSSDTRLPTDPLAIFAGRGRTFTLGWDYRF